MPTACPMDLLVKTMFAQLVHTATMPKAANNQVIGAQ